MTSAVYFQMVQKNIYIQIDRDKRMWQSVNNVRIWVKATQKFSYYSRSSGK